TVCEMKWSRRAFTRCSSASLSRSTARAKSSREIPYAPEGLTAAFPSLTASRHTRGNARKHTSGYGVKAGAVDASGVAAGAADAWVVAAGTVTGSAESADATAGACAACADRATAV